MELNEEPLNEQQLRQEVRRFVTSNFYVAAADALSDRDSLLGEGIIDSTGVLELIAFIEATLEITVEDSEMLPENLDSIDRIVRFVARKKARVSHILSP